MLIKTRLLQEQKYAPFTIKTSKYKFCLEIYSK